MILYIFLGFIVLFILAAWLGTVSAQKKAVEAGERIRLMELKYEEYVEKNIRNHILEENDLQVDPKQLAKDILIIIGPDLDGLVSLINTTIYSGVNMKYSAQYFPNLVSLTEEYFQQSQKNKSKRLSEVEVQNYKNTALDAIQADIQKRLLDLKLGDL